MSVKTTETPVEECIAQYCASQFGSALIADADSTRRVDTSHLAEFGALNIQALYRRHADAPGKPATP
jgi:hypothetical protein